MWKGLLDLKNVSEGLFNDLIYSTAESNRHSRKRLDSNCYSIVYNSTLSLN